MITKIIDFVSGLSLMFNLNISKNEDANIYFIKIALKS